MKIHGIVKIVKKEQNKKKEGKGNDGYTKNSY